MAETTLPADIAAKVAACRVTCAKCGGLGQVHDPYDVDIPDDCQACSSTGRVMPPAVAALVDAFRGELHRLAGVQKAYDLVNAGLASATELMDGLKQELRATKAALDQWRTNYSQMENTAASLISTNDKLIAVRGRLREALAKAVERLSRYNDKRLCDCANDDDCCGACEEEIFIANAHLLLNPDTEATRHEPA